MNRENLGYLAITATEIGLAIYEGTAASANGFPTTDIPKLLLLASAIPIVNCLARNLYRFPNLTLFYSIPLAATAIIEGSKYITEAFPVADQKVVYGAIILTLVANILNNPFGVKEN